MTNLDEQFSVQVFEKDGQYYCVIKELSILESGDHLAQAYEKAQSRKRAVLEQFKKANLAISPKESESGKKKRGLAQFSLNLLLLSLFLMVPIVSLTRPLSVVFSRLANVLQLKPIEFIVQLNEHMEQMPVEKKTEFKRSIHSLMAQFDELKEVSAE